VTFRCVSLCHEPEVDYTGRNRRIANWETKRRRFAGGLFSMLSLTGLFLQLSPAVLSFELRRSPRRDRLICEHS